MSILAEVTLWADGAVVPSDPHAEDMKDNANLTITVRSEERDVIVELQTPNADGGGRFLVSKEKIRALAAMLTAISSA